MPTNAPEVITTLFEEICDPHVPVPIPCTVTGFKEWSKFVTFMSNRVKAALFAIMTHPTDASMSHLYVGGDLGLLPALRMLEFTRRSVKTDQLHGDFLGSSDIEELVKYAEIVLGREMWRRWSSGSFVQIRHLLGGKLCGYWHIFLEAAMQSGIDVESEVCL